MEVINEHDTPVKKLVDLLILLDMVYRRFLNHRYQIALGNAILALHDLCPLTLYGQCVLLRLCQGVHLG
jgi:hypothetical protein